MLTIKQAFDNWSAEIKPLVIAQYSADDEVALSESWNDYTDSLCKDGELSDLQYHHCPAWDDDMPDDDREFILDAMGLRMAVTSLAECPDRDANWPGGSTHYRVLLQRNGAELSTPYSMGSALTHAPEMPDVVYSLLSDADGVEGETFEDWAENLGFDTDSRKAEYIYNACRETAIRLKLLFTPAELDDLRELFADY